jgi:L-2-hydroxyglutarate oxidase LhgO
MAHNEAVDVVLVGAGIMSATLAVLLKELDPNLTLEVVELMDSGAAESSNPWNNAGTGHAGLCELNYTPQAADGSIDIKKSGTHQHPVRGLEAVLVLYDQERHIRLIEIIYHPGTAP